MVKKERLEQTSQVMKKSWQKKKERGDGQQKRCPNCGIHVPEELKICPNCSHVFTF